MQITASHGFFGAGRRLTFTLGRRSPGYLSGLMSPISLYSGCVLLQTWALKRCGEQAKGNNSQTLLPPAKGRHGRGSH